MTLDINSLESAASHWEWAGYVASALVLAGVILESVEIISGIKSGHWRTKRIETFAILILVAGLALEILAEAQSNRATGLIEALLNGEAQAAENDAAKANESAAKLQAANLQMEAKIYEQATYLGGRQLTKDQFDAIQSVRGKLPAILFVTEAHCPECFHFVDQLGVAFAHAGVQVALTMPNNFIGVGLRGGFCVYDSPNADLVDETLQNAGFLVGKCGHAALALFGISDPDRAVVGVGEQQQFSPPVKGYTEPP